MQPKMQMAYIGVGSNVEPNKNIKKALELLIQKVSVLGCSTFYNTKALNRPDQDDFHNGVWQIDTNYSPKSLKQDVLRSIETTLGRQRDTDSYAPRTIDLDILLFGQIVTHEPGLRLPDPDIVNRAFLKVPLLELDEDLILPDLNMPLSHFVTATDYTDLAALDQFTRDLRETCHKH